MALPIPQPAVVILDVMNLRGTEGKRKDAPFDIGHFDGFVAAISSSLPSAVTIGIVDGTATIEGRRNNFATGDDRRELLRRTQLDPAHPLHLYLLPPPEKRGWLRRTDLKYLPADPVCVHLLSKFSKNAALITFDLFDKDYDIAYFPANHALRESVFAPIWLSSENSWVYLARSEISRFRRANRKISKAVENGEFRRLEDSLAPVVISLQEFAEVRNHAYGLIHDLVNEHRAAGNRTVPQVLEWQRSRSAFDVLDPSKFAPPPVAEPVSELEQTDDLPVFSDVNVMVRTVTEHVDLIRSIDELQSYLGRRVRVTAFLRTLEKIPYLFWLGQSSRVRLDFQRGQPDVLEGLVTVEGLVETRGDDLVLSITSGTDIMYQSIAQIVLSRAKRLIRPASYVGGEGSLDLPVLPRNPRRHVPPPPARGGSPISTGQPNSETIDPATGFESSEDASVDPSGDSASLQPVQTQPPVPEVDIEEPSVLDSEDEELEEVTSNSRDKIRVTRRLVFAIIIAATLIATGLILRQALFGFSVPTPQVCESLEPAACDVVIKEWRGDAIRVYIYGSRDISGVIR